MAAVAMEVGPPPAPHAAKRPVKKTQKKRGSVLCSIQGCSKLGQPFSTQSLLRHMRSKHRSEPKAQSKTKELNVYAALQAAGIECEYKKPIKFRRCGSHCEKGIFLDIAITTHWGVIVLQVDVHQHASYPAECDLRRDYNTYVSIARNRERKVAILRYNPDEFHIDGKNVRVETEERHRRLVEVLRAWMAEDWVPTRPFARFFMYYDSESGSNLPLVAKDWDSDEARVISAVVPMRA